MTLPSDRSEAGGQESDESPEAERDRAERKADYWRQRCLEAMPVIAAAHRLREAAEHTAYRDTAQLRINALPLWDDFSQALAAFDAGPCKTRLEGMAAPGETTERARKLAAKTEINKRVQARYGELMHEGKHGHYETLFRIVHEERAAAEDGARRATAIKAAHIVRAQQDSEHPATYGEIAKAIMALAEATPAK